MGKDLGGLLSTSIKRSTIQVYRAYWSVVMVLRA